MNYTLRYKAQSELICNRHDKLVIFLKKRQCKLAWKAKLQSVIWSRWKLKSFKQDREIFHNKHNMTMLCFYSSIETQIYQGMKQELKTGLAFPFCNIISVNNL